MKKLILLLLFVPIVSFGQYSSYYGTIDVNQNVNANVNVNKNVNVSGYVNKTVQTIDYGALANANAQRERNRIEAAKYISEKQKIDRQAIAINPEAAYDYGESRTEYLKGKDAKNFGMKKATLNHKIPNTFLFTRITGGGGYTYRNESEDNIITTISLFVPLYVNRIPDSKISSNWKKAYAEGAEESAKFKNLKVGQLNGSGDNEMFVHKKDVNKTIVWGHPGFKGTLIWEDSYEYCITDNYYATINGFVFSAKVRVKGDKDEVDFEMLEGRRYYLLKFIDKTISSAGMWYERY